MDKILRLGSQILIICLERGIKYLCNIYNNISMNIFYVFTSILLIGCAISNLNKILNTARVVANKRIIGFLNFYAVSVGLYGLWIGFN